MGLFVTLLFGEQADTYRNKRKAAKKYTQYTLYSNFVTAESIGVTYPPFNPNGSYLDMPVISEPRSGAYVSAKTQYKQTRSELLEKYIPEDGTRGRNRTRRAAKWGLI